MKTFLFVTFAAAVLLLSACGNCPVGYNSNGGACIPAYGGYATAGYGGYAAYPGVSGYPAGYAGGYGGGPVGPGGYPVPVPVPVPVTVPGYH